MNTAEVDLDRLVDYEREYRSVVKRAQVTGDHMIGLCPFHDDSKNSFSVDLKTGRWHCFSEDIGGNYVDFVAKMNGISTKDAYKRIMEDYHVEMPEKEKPAASRRSYSMEQYAFEKRLPVEFLRDTCHISNDKERKDQTTYMKIPYLKEDGTEATYRKRFAGKEFRWRYGSSGKICLYGEWRLPQMRQSGYACLVEGESDTQSMWYMGISTLGVPGASMFKPNMSDQLQDLKLYIHQEPDQGGETFMRKVIQGLREGGFIGKVYKFSCSTLGGIKDPSDVFIKFGKEEGAAKIQKLLERAEEIDLAEPDVIPESIKGAPVNLRQPEGWIYSDKGISHIDEKTYGPVMVCRTPIILTQRLRSLETGEEKIEIAFKRDDEWHRAIYPRSTIFTARGITVLADLGCTVTSENAKQVVRFLSALEAENIDIITKADATSSFGWQPGKRFIPGHDKDIVLDIDPSQKGMAAAYCQTGSFDKWKDTMQPHRERDKFRFILAAAFAIPAGTRVTDGEAYFTTDEYAEIKAGETTVDVACTSIETGVDLNGIHEGAIQTLVDPIPYIESVTNITETDGGADPESDESLKDRIYIAPSRYSTAGTEEAYIYWVKTYNSTIADVKVSSDNPGEVDIVFLMNDGIPSQEMITGLTKYITDPNIRPLTDKVVVKAPTAVNYSISLTYYINSSDSGSVATIQSEVAKAVDDFVTWQQSKIGRDINSSELIKRVTAAGAKRVEIKSPVFQKIGGTSIAYCTSKNVTYGGVEDD